MKKITFLIFSLIFFVFVGFVVFQQQGDNNQAIAGSDHNVFGWAWSENIGWLSFNCINCEGNAACVPSAACTGEGYNYGVNIESDGELTGYVWSRGADEEGGVGWITFNEAGTFPGADLTGCPELPCRAWVDLADGKMYGWARAVSGYAGWPGWIRLRGTAQDGSPYGVWLDFATKEFWGFAWGETAIGWLSFNLKNCDSDGDGITDDDENEWCEPGQVLPPIPPGENGPVETSFGFPPQAKNLQTSSVNLCQDSSQRFQWEFQDIEPGEQKAYRLQVDFDGNWVAGFGEIDTGYVLSTTQEKLVKISLDSEEDKLKYNTSYAWRVMVWDESDMASDWAYGPGFSTPVHKAPQPIFDYSPTRPSKDEWVIFNDQALCYDNNNNEYPCKNGGASIIYAWDFSFEDPPGFTIDYNIKGGNASSTYSALGNYVVKFRITDETLPGPNNVCTETQIVSIRPKLPIWEEVQP